MNTANWKENWKEKSFAPLSEPLDVYVALKDYVYNQMIFFILPGQLINYLTF